MIDVETCFECGVIEEQDDDKKWLRAHFVINKIEKLESELDELRSELHELENELDDFQLVMMGEEE